MIRKISVFTLAITPLLVQAQNGLDCSKVTAAVQQVYQKLPRLELTPVSGSPDSCNYTHRDNGIKNYPVGTLVVTLYGDHGKPLSSYTSPSANGGGYRQIPNLGQVAEFTDIYNNKKSMFILYRNNKCVLEIQYLTWGYSGLNNNDYSGIVRIVNGLLGPYQATDAPLTEPTTPPK